MSSPHLANALKMRVLMEMPSLFNLTGKSLSTSFLHQLINYDNGMIVDYERHLQDLQQQSSVFPANIYVLKVNSKNTRKRCEKCLN